MNVLILGGNSEIAFAVAEQFAQHAKAQITLASRDIDSLQKRANDLHIRFQVDTHAVPFDATDFTSHQAFYDNLEHTPDVVVQAFGLLGNQTKAQTDFAHAQDLMNTNLLGAISILEIVAADFEKRKSGTIISLSSVAGDRGRKVLYTYGAAKAGLTTFLSGLRNRLCKQNAHVLTVIPGVIATKMTENLPFPAALTSTPEHVAMNVYQAFVKKRNVIYTPWFWRWIMGALKLIPESVFKRLSL